jgi:hypothetical protein
MLKRGEPGIKFVSDSVLDRLDDVTRSIVDTFLSQAADSDGDSQAEKIDFEHALTVVSTFVDTLMTKTLDEYTERSTRSNSTAR